MHTLTDFEERWPFGDLPYLGQQIVSQRHAGQRCTGFQGPVDGLRHVPDLNHSFRHAYSMLACLAHVNESVVSENWARHCQVDEDRV